MAQTYTNYQPLQHQNDIRIVLLAPASSYEPKICVELKCYNLLAKGLAYNAVSYVWEDESHREEAFISIEKSELKVKPNLYLLLKHLRREDEVVSLWIDALCIDQSNRHEVAQQVTIMSDIYRISKCTFMWAGPMDFFGKSAFRVVSDLLSRESPNLSTVSYREYRSEVNNKADEGWLGLVALLHRPYWKRVWILQEVLLSERPVLCFGQHRICFKKLATLLIKLSDGHLMKDIIVDFRSIIMGLTQKFPSLAPVGVVKWPPKAYRARDYASSLLWESGGDDVLVDFITTSETLGFPLAIDMAKLYESFNPGKKYDLLRALLETRIRQSSKQHDKVYGVLGLVTGPRVDICYDTSFQELYIGITLELIKYNKNLDILSACVQFRRLDNLLLKADHPQRVDGLPSWVPDWRIYHKLSSGYLLLSRNPCIRFAAAGSSIPDIYWYSEGTQKVLSTKGRKLGSISFVSQITAKYSRYPSFENIRRIILDDWTYWCLNSTKKDVWAKLLRRCSLARWLCRKLPLQPTPEHFYGNEDEQRIAFGKTYNLGVCQDHLPDNQDQYITIPTPGPEVCPNAEFNFEAYHRLLYSCPKFFVTTTGHMGRGPYNLFEGDVVAIFLGGKVPFALRPEGTKFQLIGECYIAGAMNGEMMENSILHNTQPGEFHLI